MLSRLAGDQNQFEETFKKARECQLRKRGAKIQNCALRKTTASRSDHWRKREEAIDAPVDELSGKREKG